MFLLFYPAKLTVEEFTELIATNSVPILQENPDISFSRPAIYFAEANMRGWRRFIAPCCLTVSTVPFSLSLCEISGKGLSCLLWDHTFAKKYHFDMDYVTNYEFKDDCFRALTNESV